MADTLLRIPLDKIEPDPTQPRRADYEDHRAQDELGLQEDRPPINGGIRDDLDNDREDVTSLADSILANGVLQPILVEGVGEGRYRIVAGERRWRAARAAKEMLDAGEAHESGARAGYDYATIPAILVEAGAQRLEVQLVENIQRIGMSARDIGLALKTLQERDGLSIRGMAHKLGKNTGWVQNMLLAATDEGQWLAQELGSEDWHFVRRMKTVQASLPAAYRRILNRVRSGELFSRRMFHDECSAARKEQSAEKAALKSTVGPVKAGRDAGEQRPVLSRKSVTARTGQEALRKDGGGRPAEDDVPLDALFEDSVDLSTTPAKAPTRPPERETTFSKLPGESDAEWLIRTGSASYTAAIEMGELDEELEVNLRPDMTRAPRKEPEVDILVRLPRSRAEALAGLVEGLLTDKRLPTPHRIEGETGRAVAQRIIKLLEKAGG